MTGVTSSTANGTYGIGQQVSIDVSFSESVDVTGTPQLALETGTTDRVADYASGSGGTTLSFSYTVQAGDKSSDLDYLSTNALALNGGTIKDAAGNDATLTLASPGAANSLWANKALVIDSVVPVVTALSPSEGSIAGGDTVVITGTGFNFVTGVSFGGTGAVFTINSFTQITATTPPGVVGSVDVTVSSPTNTSATGSASTLKPTPRSPAHP